MTRKSDHNLDASLAFIIGATEDDLSTIIAAITQTYTARYPDQEFLFLSLPKDDPQECKRTLDAIYNILHAQT